MKKDHAGTIVLVYTVTAILFVVTAYAKTWIWEPWAAACVIWCFLRLATMGKRRTWKGVIALETHAAARNRAMNRAHDPWGVHIIALVTMGVVFWYIKYGSTIHPLP